MSKDLIDIEVAEALATLHRKYPGQRVRVSVVLEGDQPADFFASVEHLGSPFDGHTAFGHSAHEAVEKLIAKAGDHNQMDYRRIKISQLEDELAELKRALPDYLQPMGDNDKIEAHERNYGLPPELP